MKIRTATIADVGAISKMDGPIIRDVRMVGMPLQVTRIRVAAYARVSTDGEEQLQSFQSQKQYYQDKISQNKEWVMVGIYADEGITGTKTKKRDNFLKMIEDCMNGLIDVVMTKPVSRFSQNLVDTLQYVRMVKDRGVTIIFEKENINTSTMESEMQLALLATLAQNEVESLSQNVKMDVKMKIRRGEMMGFNGCLGYDYHQEDKSITVNEVEAETVRFIFDRYIEGYGAYTIAKELTALGKVNKKGEVKWTGSVFEESLRMRSIRAICYRARLIQLILFQSEDWITVGRKTDSISKTTTKRLFQERCGIRRRKSVRADTRRILML